MSHSHPRAIRVTTRDSVATVVNGPVVVGDTLRGEAHGQPWAIALPDLAAVAVRRASPAHTALLMGGLFAFTAGAIAVGNGDGGESTLRN